MACAGVSEEAWGPVTSCRAQEQDYHERNQITEWTRLTRRKWEATSWNWPHTSLQGLFLQHVHNSVLSCDHSLLSLLHEINMRGCMHTDSADLCIRESKPCFPHQTLFLIQVCYFKRHWSWVQKAKLHRTCTWSRSFHENNFYPAVLVLHKKKPHGRSVEEEEEEGERERGSGAAASGRGGRLEEWRRFVPLYWEQGGAREDEEREEEREEREGGEEEREEERRGGDVVTPSSIIHLYLYMSL